MTSNIVEKNNQWYCYVLISNHPNYPEYSYIGFSNNVTKRLDVHNGLKSGNGAKSTKSKRPWDLFMIISGFVTKEQAMSFEWRLKHPLGKKTSCAKFSKVNGKINSLDHIMTHYYMLEPYTCLINESYKNFISEESMIIITKRKYQIEKIE